MFRNPTSNEPFNVDQTYVHNKSELILPCGSLALEDVKQILAFLDKNPEITLLSLSGNTIKEDGIKLLAANKTIRVLYLCVADISKESAITLAANTSLKEVYLNDNPQIEDEAASAFGQNQTLIKLHLMGCSISDRGAKALIANPNIIELGLNDNIAITAETKQFIEETNSIRRENYDREMGKMAQMSPLLKASLFKEKPLAADQSPLSPDLTSMLNSSNK
jgi:Ran GTPase-activating protein (RanGAP) involved in mRNA processing and transport